MLLCSRPLTVNKWSWCVAKKAYEVLGADGGIPGSCGGKGTRKRDQEYLSTRKLGETGKPQETQEK
jgi:hypothetical protein